MFLALPNPDISAIQFSVGHLGSASPELSGRPTLPLSAEVADPLPQVSTPVRGSV